VAYGFEQLYGRLRAIPGCAIARYRGRSLEKVPLQPLLGTG
jgi:hypothetical protein